MENASQALIIVAGALIGIMILSLGVTLVSSLTSYVDSSQETIRFNELNSFNTQFLNYANSENLTIHDVVTVANLANENNMSYNIFTPEKINVSRGQPSTTYVAVYLKIGHTEEAIEADIQDRTSNLLADNIGKKFKCTDVVISEITGRVYEVHFEKIT